MANNYTWPLNVPQFTVLDKLKIAKFVLFNDQWTMGKKVAEIEKKMAELVGSKYAVFVSSGSTANTLVAMMLKDLYKRANTIIFPSTTWTTSVSPFLREGFTPKFIDVNLQDFSLDLDKVEEYLDKNAKTVSAIFITSLIGLVPDIERLQRISQKYDVLVLMDNCENSLGTYNDKNISSYFTSTTSTYFGHQLQSVEGGFVFTNSQQQYEYLLMARNHGMVRALPANRQSLYRNPDVDPKFDFNLLGNNFRNSDINAFIGLLDIDRAEEYSFKRQVLYAKFQIWVDNAKYLFPKHSYGRKHVPFCLPIIAHRSNSERYTNARNLCENMGIETRPIISGNLLRQNCYKKFVNDPKEFANSEYLHKFGFYVGLHAKVDPEHVRTLGRLLNDF